MSMKHIFLALLISACTDPVLDTPVLAPPSAMPPETNKDTSPSLGVSLSGVVRDSEQNLLSGVIVRLNKQQTHTDQTGFFQFTELEPGEFKLIAEAPGYQPVAVTVQIQARSQVQDLTLQKLLTPSPSPLASLQPIFLTPSPPDPSASPQPLVTASPTDSSQATSSPIATASPSSLYDPQLDEAARVELFLKRKNNGIQLNFLLFRRNGLPVAWEWGVVQVEYYLAEPLTEGGLTKPGNLISSGRSVLTASNQPFLLTLDEAILSRLGDQVYATCTLTLPDSRLLTLRQVVNVNR